VAAQLRAAAKAAAAAAGASSAQCLADAQQLYGHISRRLDAATGKRAACELQILLHALQATMEQPDKTLDSKHTLGGACPQTLASSSVSMLVGMTRVDCVTASCCMLHAVC